MRNSTAQAESGVSQTYLRLRSLERMDRAYHDLRELLAREIEDRSTTESGVIPDRNKTLPSEETAQREDSREHTSEHGPPAVVQGQSQSQEQKQEQRSASQELRELLRCVRNLWQLFDNNMDWLSKNHPIFCVALLFVAFVPLVLVVVGELNMLLSR